MAAHLAYYEVLGLDAPPADRKAVKRAYSKMLKVTRPEDDPDGFMRLRDAHDIALNIVAREAENAAWQAEQAQQASPPESESESSQPEGPADVNSLTYEDLIPDEAPRSDTAYAIGPTASLDAPPPETPETIADTSYSIGPTPALNAPIQFAAPEEPKAPPLIDMIETLLEKPENYNNRENWNILFRKARQLDIDDYVDFEHLLLESILRFQGYYDHENPLYDTPEKIHQKFSPSIAASLFKTMSWDQVNTQGYHRGHQVEWLGRRMMVRKHRPGSVPIPETKSGGSGKVWLFLLGIFILSRILIALGDS